MVEIQRRKADIPGRIAHGPSAGPDQALTYRADPQRRVALAMVTCTVGRGSRRREALNVGQLQSSMRA